MSSRPSPPRVGRFRRCLRFGRRVALAAVLLVGCVLVYLNQAGLPEFVKKRLVAELRARGVALEFGRMRLRWYRGIVAEGVTLGRSDTPDGAELNLPELVLRFDPWELLRLRFNVHAVEVHGGQLRLPLPGTRQPVERLAVDDIAAEIRFLAGDMWSLDRLTARSLGANLHFSGHLAHASAVGQWRVSSPAGQPVSWEQPLLRFVHAVKRLKLEQPPDLHLDIHADALDPAAVTVTLRFATAYAETDWGTLGRLRLTALLNQPTEVPGEGRFQLRLESDDVRTRWTNAGHVEADLAWTQALTNLMPASLEGSFTFINLASPWGETPHLRFAASGRASPDNPAQFHSRLRLDAGGVAADVGSTSGHTVEMEFVHDAETWWPVRGDYMIDVRDPNFGSGQARRFQLAGHLERRSPAEPPAPADWGWWGWLAPVELTAHAELEGLSLSTVVVDHLQGDLAWSAPAFRLQNLQAQLFERSVRAQAQVDVATRDALAETAFDFDVRRLQPLLSDKAWRWLDPYQWTPDAPPAVAGRAWARLPPWTNGLSGWSAFDRESFGLHGTVDATNATYRGVHIDTVKFQFGYTNRYWHLTDFTATAPAGQVQFEYLENEQTKDYRFDLQAKVDPHVLQPLVPASQQRAFDLFAFEEPPSVSGFVTGRWRVGERTGFGLDLAVPAFRFRGEPIESLAARLDYTNAFVAATGVQVRAGGLVSADGAGFDTARQWLFLTNAQSSVDPALVARLIGPQVERTLNPYRFEQPPRARVDGDLNVRNTRQANLRFEVAGGPFRYWRFQLPDVRSLVLWSNETVRLPGLDLPFYGGRLQADIHVDLNFSPGAAFGFQARVADVDLHQLMADLLSPTNKLEGRLSGTWNVSRAESEDWHSWQGYGQAELQDGFLWDIPLFGAFTEILEGLMPRVGRSRVSGLTGTFKMVDSVFHTTDLQLHSAAMRLDYRGSIDFDGRVDARVEARLLRRAAIVGPLVSTLLLPLSKLFEYRVTGTLGEPKTEPIYIPKPLLFPLNPIGTLKEIFAPEKSEKPPRE